MRLLFLNHNVRGAGTYLRAFQLARALVERGHEITLMTTSAAARWAIGSEHVQGVEVIEAPDLLVGRGRTGWDPWNTGRRILRLRERGFDLIHAFDSRPVVIYPALVAQYWTGAPLVMDWADWWGRGGWINDRSGWFVRTFFGPFETWHEESFRCLAAGTTTISRPLAERAITLGVTRESVMLLPNGCDCVGVQALDRAQARRQLNLPVRECLLVHVGVLTPGDLELLLNAFSLARGEQPKLHLALVGRTAIRVGQIPGVTVTGPVTTSQLHNWIAAGDACVVPCRNTIGNRGRWPSKVNDYLAAGRPVVMPRVGDAGELIAQSCAGWATSANAESLAGGMLAALVPSDRDRAGGVARLLARQVLAWPLLAQQLEAFYQRTLQSAHSLAARARLPLRTAS